MPVAVKQALDLENGPNHEDHDDASDQERGEETWIEKPPTAAIATIARIGSPRTIVITIAAVRDMEILLRRWDVGSDKTITMVAEKRRLRADCILLH